MISKSLQCNIIMYLYSQELTISKLVADKTLDSVDMNTFSSCKIGLGSIDKHACIVISCNAYMPLNCNKIQDRAHTCPSLEISDLFIQRSNFAFGRYNTFQMTKTVTI